MLESMLDKGNIQAADFTEVESLSSKNKMFNIYYV